MVIIKLGGGLIAPKSWIEETVDLPLLRRLVREIGMSGKEVLIVSGSGNFGHKAVKKYGISSPEAVGKVRRSARKIGEIVAEEMAKHGFAVQLVETHKYFCSNQQIDMSKTSVFYGDVVEVGAGKWEIYSGEKIIKLLMPILIGRGLEIEKIIQVSKEDGVWDSQKQIIPEISIQNWEQVEKNVLGSEGVDMTGGMLHKVRESLEIGRNYGVNTWIINGKVEGRLRKLLDGEIVLGTVVS